MNSKNYHIVLFDDVCVLCNSFAKFIINKDKKGVRSFNNNEKKPRSGLIVGSIEKATNPENPI